ncbi:hypothetical protein AUP68_06040 [Ilyonectria robusta]
MYRSITGEDTVTASPLHAGHRGCGRSGSFGPGPTGRRKLTERSLRHFLPSQGGGIDGLLLRSLESKSTFMLGVFYSPARVMVSRYETWCSRAGCWPTPLLAGEATEAVEAQHEAAPGST